jgi:hypothetical protein
MSIIEAMKDVWRAYRKAVYAYLLAGFLVGVMLTHEAILTRLAQQPNLAQVELNKVEASHRSVFVAGWRPAIGWVAAASLFFFYVPQYVVATIVWIKLLVANDWVMVPYPVGVDGVMELVIALLGMGALRTVDKAAKRTK